jgi:hypothetical protein
MKLFALAALFCLLIAIPVSQYLPNLTRDEAIATEIDLEAAVPKDFHGWRCEDVPLGSSEAVAESASKMLSMDAFVQRRYTRGRDEITIYVAHWKPGKMDTRLVASHTPDRCWTENGWTCEQMRFNVVPEIEGMTIQPAQYRIFDISGHKETVLFWLLVNREIYQFGERLNSIPDPSLFIRDFFREMFRGRPENFFIRISSNLREDQLLREPLIKTVLLNLAPTGVSLPAGDQDAHGATLSNSGSIQQ